MNTMIRMTASGGVRCAVEDLNPKGEKTILFVHGWPLCRELFEWQYDILPQYNIRCISVDLRGFGDSDKPWGDYSYDALCDDLYCIIRRLNIPCLCLLGFSMGAGACIRYMAKYNGYGVNRLALVGAAAPSFVQRPGYPYGMTREGVDTWIAGCYNDRFQTFSSFGSMCFAKPVSPQLLDWFCGLGEKAAGYACIKTLETLRDADLRPDLGKIKVPTAIFHGVQDQIAPYPFASELKNGIRDSYVCSFEQAGHCCFYDEKEAFNSALVDFVNSK